MDFLALKNEVTMYEIAERLHRAYHCGNAAISVDLQRVNVAYRIIGSAAELAQKAPVVAKVNPQPLRNGKNPLEMRHFGKHLLLEPMAQQQGPLLIAGWTARSLAAGKRYKELLAAVLALDASESLLEVATLQKLVDGGADNRTPISITLLKTLRVHALELVKPVADNLEKGRSGMVARAVELPG